MSLATRCPACGTVFRVVRDQLKVSDGWVRCGRCAEVFDASKALFPLDTAGMPMRTQDASPWPAPVAPSGPAANDEPPPRAAARVVSAMPPLSPVAPAAPAIPASTTASTTAPTVGPPASPPTAPPASPPMAPVQDVAARPSVDAAVPGDAASSTAVAPQAPPAEPVPGFLLRAQRAERRRRPGLALALGLLALLLVGGLVAQVALHYRDLLAASSPAARPALEAACALLGCRIEAPRRIDSLSVESSALLRIEDSTLYRLQVVVRNRAPTVVLMPALDLSLTDSQGQTTARRVLEAGELGARAERLPPQGEVALGATLDLGERRVAGYTVELFYP